MAQVGNNENRFGGEYYIQDRDHMSEIRDESNAAQTGNTRQPAQSQQGDNEQPAAQQQGGERRRKPRLL